MTYRTPVGDKQLAPGTVLRVTHPASHRDPGQRLVRGDRATVLDAGHDRVRVRFDDGHLRSLTPRALFGHLDYGYVGTTHALQGQSSEVHIAALQPTKDAASLYVSASRARQRTLFIADARDYLTPDQMHTAATWSPADFDDEVLDRMRTAHTRPHEWIDSPTAALAPSLTRSRISTGMAL